MADLIVDASSQVQTAEPSLVLRAPSTLTASSPKSFHPPSSQSLYGTWYVTQSTLPMWKSNRNVSITYSPLESPPGAVDDLVRYQPLKSDKQKTVHGIDTPRRDVQAAYQWRGRGWLKVASSRWEVIGHGEEDGGWLVTYFAKTLFTPAGIDVCSRQKAGVSAGVLDKIKAEMGKIDDHNFQAMTKQIFEIKHDR